MNENLGFKDTIATYFDEIGISRRGKGYSFLYETILLGVAYPNVNSKTITSIVCEYLNLPNYTLSYHIRSSMKEANEKRISEGKEKLTKSDIVNGAINAIWHYRKEILEHIEQTYPDNIIMALNSPEQRRSKVTETQDEP